MTRIQSVDDPIEFDFDDALIILSRGTQRMKTCGVRLSLQRPPGVLWTGSFTTTDDSFSGVQRYDDGGWNVGVGLRLPTSNLFFAREHDDHIDKTKRTFFRSSALLSFGQDGTGLVVYLHGIQKWVATD